MPWWFWVLFAIGTIGGLWAIYTLWREFTGAISSSGSEDDLECLAKYGMTKAQVDAAVEKLRT